MDEVLFLFEVKTNQAAEATGKPYHFQQCKEIIDR